jgi:hypothetical protein
MQLEASFLAFTFSKVRGLERITFNNVSHDFIWQCRRRKMDDMLFVQTISFFLYLINTTKYVSTK